MNSLQKPLLSLWLLCAVSAVDTFAAQPRIEWTLDYAPLVYNFDYITCSDVDRDGNLYLGGAAYSLDEGYYNYELAKVAPDGALAWIGRDPLPGNQPEALAMALNEAGQAVMTGYGGTVKFNANGERAWHLSIHGADVKVDAADNILLAGIDRRLIKLNAAGQVLWVQPHDAEPFLPFSRQLAVDGSGATYVIGFTNPLFPDWITIKFDSAGHRLWTRTYDTPKVLSDDPFLSVWDSDIPADLVLDSTGNLIVVGHAIDYGREILYDRDFRDTLAIKYDPDGRVLWTARLPRIYTMCRAALDAKDNLYIVGRDGIEDESSYSISKLDRRGRHVWTTAFTGFFSWATGFAVDARGNSYLAASFGEPDNSLDSVLKFDPHGRQVWSAPFSTDRSLRDLRLDANGNVYAIGENNVVKYVEGK